MPQALCAVKQVLYSYCKYYSVGLDNMVKWGIIIDKIYMMCKIYFISGRTLMILLSLFSRVITQAEAHVHQVALKIRRNR